tara:strand:- start:2460 stop:2735 length:276 start_codon:yes stop_codon:yes gene_type:complete
MGSEDTKMPELGGRTVRDYMMDRGVKDVTFWNPDRKGAYRIIGIESSVSPFFSVDYGSEKTTTVPVATSLDHREVIVPEESEGGFESKLYG